MKINGCDLILARPVVNWTTYDIDRWVVVVDRDSEYAVGWVNSLDDSEWYAGSYVTSLSRALDIADERVASRNKFVNEVSA